MCQKLDKLACRELNFGTHPNFGIDQIAHLNNFNTDKRELKFVTLTIHQLFKDSKITK